MSVLFDAAADRLLRTANMPSAAGPWTVSCWVRTPASVSGAYKTVLYVGTNDYATVVCYAGINNATQWNVSSGAAEFGGGTPSILTWYHFLVTRDEALTPDASLYIDGALVTSGSGANGGAPTRFEFGGVGTSNFDVWDGQIAAFKWWDVVLSTEEREAERFSILPRRYANLQGFYPTIQGSAADLPEDWSGNGRNFTVGGTLTVEDGPPISWGSPVLYVDRPSGGASAALTGTALAGITEADLVAGGKTIIITLSGDSWIPS